MENQPVVLRSMVAKGVCTGPGDVTYGRSDTGTEQMGLVFEVTSGHYAGRRLPWYGTLDSEKALALVKETLETSGWDGESIAMMGGLGSRTVQLAIDVIEIEGRDGQPREVPKIRFVNRLAQATMKNPIEGDERAAMTAKLEARMRQIAPNGARSSSRRAGGSPEEERAFGDDVP